MNQKEFWLFDDCLRIDGRDGSFLETVSAPEKPYQTAQVYIDCPTDITKDAYVQAAVRIVDPNGRFAEIDDGEATVKVRGNSTSSGAKKPYNIKLSSKKDVLGMGRAKKWCLLANLYDKTMLRNKLSYDFAAEIGMDYVSSCEFAELYLNGVYRGCYLLTEAVEIGETRVDLLEDGNVLHDNTDILLDIVAVRLHILSKDRDRSFVIF